MLPKMSSRTILDTPESRYACVKTAGWLVDLLDMNARLSVQFFECASWVLGGLDSLVSEVLQSVRPFVQDIWNEGELETMNALEMCPSRQIPVLMEDFLQSYPRHEPFARSIFREKCFEESQVEVRRPECFVGAEGHLTGLFGLDDASLRLCEFLFINRAFSQVECLFEDDAHVLRFEGFALLAQMIGITPARCRSIIKNLVFLGVVKLESSCILLEKQIWNLWYESDENLVMESFCMPLSGETLPLELFPIETGQIEHARTLLEQSDDEPLHILFYGPPGTGKTTFARSLAHACGLPAWAAGSGQDEGGDRRSQLVVGGRIASLHDRGFLLVDEAERILDCDMFAREHSIDKAWLNTFMSKPGQRVIWITNHVHHLEGAIRRRFDFSIHFRALGRRERYVMWRQILERHGMATFLPDDTVAEFAKEFDIPASVMEMAVKQAKRFTAGTKEGVVVALRRVIDSYDILLRDGRSKSARPKVAKSYDIDGVSLDVSVEYLLATLNRLDVFMRQGREPVAGAGAILFYGPPGTGKTALARYLAERIDRECRVVRASDLLGPYVGMTEAKIAEAFRDAEREDAVLVIDEVDSFLFPRDMAKHSWETTQVNELLTALEECRGFCICTTNRRENMDQAVMRRFSHKIAFTYSKPEQVKALYDALLAPLAPEPLPKELEAELLAMRRLTPGDFHAVRSRMLFDDERGATHHELLQGLHREQDLKLDSDRRGMGFLK